MRPETAKLDEKFWRDRITSLSQSTWEGRVRNQALEDWLRGFKGEIFDEDIEHKCALFLLHHVIYFGRQEVEALLYALYRDHILYPTIQEIISENTNRSEKEIRRLLKARLDKIRIIPVGNISESGSMLMYPLRQQAELPTTSVRTMPEIIQSVATGSNGINHVILIDDMLGTGDQLCDKHQRDASTLKSRGITVDYMALVAMNRGLQNVRYHNLFNSVGAVIALAPEYSLTDPNPLIFKELSDCEITPDQCMAVARHYGNKLIPEHPLGYKNCGLLIAFSHNTPDNTLPIFWHQSTTPFWAPPFPRHQKFD